MVIVSAGCVPLGLTVQFLPSGECRLAIRLGAATFGLLTIWKKLSCEPIERLGSDHSPRVVFFGGLLLGALPLPPPPKILNISAPKPLLDGVCGSSTMFCTVHSGAVGRAGETLAPQC